MRWTEMEEGLRWFKHLHQPESIAKAFIECGRSFRGDTHAIGMNKATHGSNFDSDDFWKQQGQFDDILFDVHLDCIKTAQKLSSCRCSLNFGMLHDVTVQCWGKRQEAEMQLSTGPPSFALCGGESYDKSQENCCGGLVGICEPCDLHPAHFQITSTSPHQQLHMF